MKRERQNKIHTAMDIGIDHRCSYVVVMAIAVDSTERVS